MDGTKNNAMKHFNAVAAICTSAVMTCTADAMPRPGFSFKYAPNATLLPSFSTMQSE